MTFDRRWYKRHTLKEMQTLRVRSVCALRTGMMLIPAGTLLRITEKYNGLVVVQNDACACCGVSVYVRGVDPSSLERVPDDA